MATNIAIMELEMRSLIIIRDSKERFDGEFTVHDIAEPSQRYSVSDLLLCSGFLRASSSQNR